MSHSYRSLLLHIVFATKQRRPLIRPDLRERLNAYISTAIRDRHGEPLAISGTEDHLHILLDKKPGVDEMAMIRDIKAWSSGWIHKTFKDLEDFGWQNGYAMFSVSGTHKQALMEYIGSQADHHKELTLREEVRRLLERAGIKYDERFLWA